MAERPDPNRLDDQPAWYEIRIGAVLDSHWAAWFDGMRMTVLDQHVTRLAGPVIDEAALYGLLDRIRDLRLPLVLVRQIPPEPNVGGATARRPS